MGMYRYFTRDLAGRKVYLSFEAACFRALRMGERLECETTPPTLLERVHGWFWLRWAWIRHYLGAA